MDDIKVFLKNAESYKESIINTLNLDAEVLENRINEELFNTYIDVVLKKELEDKEELVILFNPIIIKLAKVQKIYNKYAKDITKLSHLEYIEKIKKNLNDKKNNEIILNFITNNSYIDYDNEIENYILTLYANKILKNNLDSIEEQKWFINYIINFNAKKQGLSFNVVGLIFPKIKKYTLIKNNIPIKITNILNYYDKNSIYINLGIFNLLKRKNNFNRALLYLINSCLLELQKQIQRSKEFAMNYDDNIYRFIKESIIYSFDSEFYNENKKYFDMQINLKDETNKMLKELVNNPLFKDFDFMNDINIDNDDMLKNTRNYNLIDNFIDSILIKKPEILETYPLLKMEYNSNGTRKSLKELLKIKSDKISSFKEQIKTFNEILKEAPNESYKRDITNKLNILENSLPGIIRCHNKMIYKVLRVIRISQLENLCLTLTKEQLDTLEEVVIQEKNDFIKKLEDNRKKIFKPSTFLENEQFLTDEYSLSARYESKLRDIRKENNI